MEFRGWLAMWARLVLGLVVAATVGTPVLIALNDPSQVGEAGIAVAVAAVALMTIMLAMGSVTLTVAPETVTIRYGRTPFRTVLRYSSMTGVDTVHLKAWKWGGVGYRGSRRLFKQAAVLLRSGPAVRFHLDDGSTLAVTVDRAEAAREAVASRLRVSA